jgi:hypothetical protein
MLSYKTIITTCLKRVGTGFGLFIKVMIGGVIALLAVTGFLTGKRYGTLNLKNMWLSVILKS